MTTTHCKYEDANQRAHRHAEPTNVPGTPATVAVENEVRTLVGRLPQHDRALVRAMFGLDGRAARHGVQLRKEFKLNNAQIKEAMQRSLRTLWFAHLIDELPAVCALLGEDRSAWPARVWEHTDHLLDREARTRYAQLLLVLAGTPADEIETRLGDYLRELRALERGAEHKRLLRRATRDRARRELTRLIDHTIWPETLREVRDLSGYRTMRKLRPDNANGGYFLSRKLHRFVQYDSGLERHVFETFDGDGRIAAYQEQPVRLRFTLDGRQLPYTPDGIALIRCEGCAIAVELKPEHQFGYIENWLRWRALWNWCCENGVGMFIGSPRTTILDFYRQAEDSPLRSELAEAVEECPVDRERYLQFKRDHNASMRDIARAVTALQLDWRPEPLSITRPTAEHAAAAKEFWNAIALAAIGLETEPA